MTSFRFSPEFTSEPISSGSFLFFERSLLISLDIGIPRWHNSKESTCQCRRYKRCWFSSWVRKILTGEGNGNPLQYSCVGKPMDTGSLEGYSPWGRLESDMAEQLSMYIYICMYMYMYIYAFSYNLFLLMWVLTSCTFQGIGSFHLLSPICGHRVVDNIPCLALQCPWYLQGCSLFSDISNLCPLSFS